jgi:hypothetical protein
VQVGPRAVDERVRDGLWRIIFSVLGAIYQGFRVPFFFYAISCNLTPSETDSCGGTYSVAAVCIPYLAFSLGCFGTNDLEIPKSGQK